MDLKLNFKHDKEDLAEALGLRDEDLDEINNFVVRLVLENLTVSQKFESIVEKYGHSLIRLMYAAHIYGVMRGVIQSAEKTVNLFSHLLDLTSDDRKKELN